jgi:hypothetical protein
MQHLKYNQIFDDRVDGPELDKLLGKSRRAVGSDILQEEQDLSH